MAEITVDVGVRLNVLQNSIAELERSLKNLRPDESGFKGLQKIIASMRAEMEKLQVQTSKSFSSPQQFKQAGKTVEKLEASLARAKLAVENIKFSDLKLDSNQQKAFDQVEQQIADAESKFNEFQEKVKSGIIGNNAIQDGLQLIKTSDLQKSFDDLDKIIDKSVATNTDRLAAMREELAKIKEQEAKNIVSRNILQDGISKKTFADYDKYFNDYTKKYTDQNGQEYTKDFTRYKSSFGGGNNQEVLQAIAESIGLSDQARQRFFDDLKGKSLNDINNFIKDLKPADIVKDFKQNDLSNQATQKEQEIGLLVEQLNQLKIAQSEFKNAQGDNGALAPAMEQYNNVLQQCEQTLARLRGEAIKTFQDKAGLNTGNFNVMAGEVQNFTNQLNKANTAFLRLQNQQQTFNSMRMAITNFMGFNQVLNLTKRAVNDAMNHIKQLDTTMAGISIVTDMSTADLWKQVDAYSVLAQKFGTTIQGAYDISKIYYQQGLETKDVMTLTEETLKLSKVSGLDYAKSTDYMTTALRGFKMEMQEASTVVDVYSNLAANTAVSQEELAVAMSKTASSMESVGSTFEDTSAMIATMVAVTRESATNIGSAMKSIASRYGELTKDPAKLIDSEGEAMSFNKVDEALRSVGISMQTADHQFRDFTDVIVELSEKWDTLDSTQQRYIATQFAGNRQQSRFLALVSNGDLLKENMEVAENSEDVGTLQALKAMDSIESKMNQVQVAAQQFYTTLGAEGVWKGALDGIKSYVDGLNNLPKLFDKIPLGALAVITNLISLVKGALYNGLSSIATIWQNVVTNASTSAASEAISGGGLIGNSWIGALVKAIKDGKSQVDAAKQEATTDNITTNNSQSPLDYTNNRRFVAGSAEAENMADFYLDALVTMEAGGAQFTDNTLSQLMVIGDGIRKGELSLAEASQQTNQLLFGMGESAEQTTGKFQVFFQALQQKDSSLSRGLTGLAQSLTTVGMLIDKTSASGRILSGVMTGLGGALQTGLAGIRVFSGDLSALPQLAMGVFNVINGISTAYENAEEHAERLSKVAEETSNKAKEEKANYNVLDRSISKLKELEKARYDSAEAAEEYQTAVDELADKYPQLITGLDAAGNATIEAANLDYELEKARRAAAEATLVAAKAEREKAQEELQVAQNKLEETRGSISNEEKVFSDYFSPNYSNIGKRSLTDFTLPGWFGSEDSALEQLNIDLNKQYSQQEILKKLVDTGNFAIEKDEFENFILPDRDYIVGQLTGLYQATFEDASRFYDEIAFLTEDVSSIDTNKVESFSKSIQELPKAENFDTAVANLSAEIAKAKLQDVFPDFMEYASNLASGLDEVNQLSEVIEATKKVELSAAINNLGKEQQEFVESLGDASGVLTAYIYDLAEGKDIEEYIKTQLKGDYQQFQEVYKAISASNVKTGQFQDMWKNRQNYTVKDFYDKFEIDGTDDPLGINAYYEQNMMDVESLKTRLLQQMDQTSVDKEGITTEFGKANTSLKTILKDTEEISPALANFASDAINQAQDYFEQGFVDKGTDVLNATGQIIQAVNKDGVDSGAINALIKQYGISNIDSISNIIENIPEGTDPAVEGAFKALQSALLYNLPLAIQAYTSDLTSNIEGYESKIKKTSSGMSVSEAMEALELVNAKRTDSEQFHLTDFNNKNGKLTMQSDLRQQYTKAIVDDLNSQYEEIETKISEFIGKKENGIFTKGEYTEDLKALGKGENEEVLTDLPTEVLNLLSNLKIIEKNADGEWHYVEDMVRDTTSIFDLVSSLLTQQSANALELREYAAKQIPAAAALEAGDISEYFKGLGANNVDLKKVAGGDFKGIELPYEQIKAGKDKINEIYDQFISDVFSKGIENIDLRDYEGIYKQADDETKNAIQAALDSGNYQEIVNLTAELAGKTVQQTNDLVIQAIEVSDSYKKEIASSDVIKDINFLAPNIAYATLDTIKALADNLGIEDINTLFDINSFDAALGGYKVDMTTLAENGFSEIVNSSNIVADSVKAFLDSISEGIGKGLEGKLDFTERDNLISNLGKYGMELDATDFTRTADGLKLSEQKAIELYNTLKQIDGISAQITFDTLAKSLEDNNENYTNISTIAKRIADLQREIDNPDVSTARRQEYEAELAVAEEIYRVRSSTDNKSFDFMNRDLPNGMQNPIDYWNSTGEAYKAMNQAAKSGYMEIQDFYNIVNEMNNMAAVSGQTLSFMGQTLSGKAEDAAALIEAGMSALKNVDGEGVKIALGSLGVDFATGAADMTGDFDTGIKAMAKSQIKMLDAAINMLEAIVALQDIDVGENGVLDVGEVFTFDEDGKLLGFTSDIENWLNKVEALCGPIEIGGISLRDALLQMAESGQEGQEKAVQFLNDLRNLDFETGNIADVSAKINNLISTFWPGKTITTGPSIFEILDIPKNLSEKSEAFKKWADDLDIGVDTASRMIDLMKRGGNIGTIDSTYGKAIQKLLGIDEKTKEQFTAFLDDGKHITTADIQRWSNINFEENVEGVVEGTYNGSDGGSITLSGDDGNAWRTQIENYEFALQQARMSGGGQVTATNDDNSEFTFTTQMGAHQVVAVTNGETTTYKFPDFEIQAATIGEALKAYAQHKKDSGNAHYSNMTAGEILSELGYVLKESTKITLQPGEDDDAKAQIEEILSHSKEEIENALNNPKNKTINDDGTVDWTIELGGQEFQITSNGEEINASTFVDNLSTQMGLDTKLIDNIVKAIQQAFEGDAGAKIGQAIREGIETAFSSAEKQVGGEGGEQQAIPVGEITLKPTSVILDISETPPQLKETPDLGESIPLGDIEGTATSVSLSSIGGVTKTDATIIANKNVGDIGDVEGTATAGEVTSIGSGWKLSKTGESGTIKLAESLGNVGADASSATVTVLDNNFLPETNEITTLEFTSATGTVATVTIKPTNGYETNNEAESLKYTGTQDAKVDQVNVKPTSYTITWTDAAGNTKTVEVSANVLLQANNYSEFVAQIQNLVKDETKTIKLEFEGEPPTIDDILNDPQLNWRPSYQGNYNTSTQSTVTPEVKAEKVEASGASIKADGATVNLSNKKNDTGNETGNQTGMDVSSVTASGPVNVSGSPVNVAGSTGGNEGNGQGGKTETPTLDISGITSALDGLRSALSKPTSAISLLAGAIGSIPTDKAQAVRRTADAINKLKDKNISVKATVQGTIRASMSATVSVDGAASASANAQIAEKKIITSSGAKGNVALAKGTNLSLATGKKQTLMGELGPELVVSNGRYYTVGNNGAEFVDLPEDAIVFNHKQTRKLLGSKGRIGGRGTPVKSEKAAISFATGNVSGPAMAGPQAALNVLKQIRSMWQSMLDASAKDLGSQGGAGRGGGGGGGGGGGEANNARYIHDLEIWYNLLRQIAKLEKDISLEEAKQNKLQNDRIANGDKIYQSYKAELKYLDQSIAKNSKLLTLRKQYYDSSVNKLKESPFGKLFTFTSDGVMQYDTNLEDYIAAVTKAGNSSFKNGKLHLQGTSIVRDAEGKAIKFKKGKKKGQAKTTTFNKDIDIANSAMDFLSLLNATDKTTGAAAYTPEEQVAILEAYGFGSVIQYDEKGQKITGDDAAIKKVENFWNQLDNIMKNTDDLFDDYLDGLQKIEESEAQQNEILDKIRDNQIDLENKVLDAVEARAQEQIDALQDQRDSLEKSNQKFLDGLKDSLDKERQMYQQNQDSQELNKLQRQLAILQRSGGSASQIRSLQEEINQKQQDSYFTAQENQINAIQEASDLQIERLDAQIDIMTETLEYQKEHGLLWNEVYQIMSGSAEQIVDFIQKYDKEFLSKGLTEQQKDTTDLLESAQMFASDRGLENEKATAWKSYLAKHPELEEEKNAQARNSIRETFYSKYDTAKNAQTAESAAEAKRKQLFPSNKGGNSGTTGSSGNTGTVKNTPAPTYSNTNVPYPGTNNAKTGLYKKPGGNRRTDIPKKNPGWLMPGHILSKIDQYSKNTYGKNGAKYRYIRMGSNTKWFPYVPARWGGLSFNDFINRYKLTQSKKYATGGIVDYTGPAWVDGTPSKPEAFLNAEQTAALKRGLFNSDLVTASIDNLRAGWDEFKEQVVNNISNNSNETVVIEKAEVNMNVSEINDDYGAHRAGQEVMAEMLKIAQKSGTRAITRR